MRSSSQRYAEQYENSDQSIWHLRSKIIIEKISRNLFKKYKYLPDLLQELAKERHDLAVQLNHTPSDKFGAFCTEDMVGWETIKSAKFVREEVIDTVENLLEQGNEVGNSLEFHIKNPFCFLFPKTDLAGKREKAIWASDVLHQNRIGHGNAYQNLRNDYKLGYNEALSSITRYPNGDIQLSYRAWNKYNVVGDYFTAQALFDDLLECNKDDPDAFLTAAAKFSYFMVHCFFTRRGLASMTEWIVRGIAKHHQIDLGDFKADRIGWSWRALVTASINEYVDWYKDNCFIVNKPPNKLSNKSLGLFSRDRSDLEESGLLSVENSNQSHAIPEARI